MSRPLPIRMGQRVRPRTPPAAMITYRIDSPVQTHTRPATCAEVDCARWRTGWDAIVPKGSSHEALIREVARGHGPDGVRRPYARVTDHGPTRTYHYAPGTTCFKASEHRVSLDRPELFIVRGGDWRQNRGLIRRHTGRRAGEHWVEDCQTNLDAVRRQIGA